MLTPLLIACLLLAIGLWLRSSLAPLRRLYIPSAAVGGIVGFALVQAALRADFLSRIRPLARSLTTEWATWPGILIAVVFAALLLEKPSDKPPGEAIRRGARSAILAWIIILGQIAIGLIVFIVIVHPSRPAVPASFAQLLEVSWAGGHGSSTAMGAVYERQGFAEGKDLAFFLATVGLIFGVAFGLVLVNLALRRGWTSRATTPTAPDRSPVNDRAPGRSFSPRQPVSLGTARSRADVLEPLVLQILLLAGAFAIGLGLQRATAWAANLLAGYLPGAAAQDLILGAGNLPLFLFTLLGGLILRNLLSMRRLGDLLDTPTLQRLVGVAMEFLIVAAIATMRVEALGKFGLAVAALVVLAAAWSALTLLVIAPRLLPRGYWFELGLLNYGFSTANTPQGFMLLRIIDPELQSGAAEDYALAAPLSAPFVGGGLLTVTAFPFLLGRVHPVLALGALLVAVAVLYALGRALAREGKK